MFEDIEKFLKQNKKLLPNNDGDNKPKHDGMPTPNDVLKAMQDAFGEGVRIEHVGEGSKIKGMVISQGEGDGIDKARLLERLAGMIDSMTLIAQATPLKPRCVDAKGKPLSVGNYIKCTNGSRKKVLELGYGYVRLSRTDEFDKIDAYWFENEIKKAKFIKE